MKNIVFVTPSIGFGGAAKMLVYVANCLCQRGHNVSIINFNLTSKSIDHKVDERIKIYNHNVELHGFKRLKSVSFINDIAKKERADVLIGFTLFPNVYNVFSSKMIGVPCIMSERGDPYITLKNGFLDKIFVKIINSSTGGVFQTDGAKAFYGKGAGYRKR